MVIIMKGAIAMLAKLWIAATLILATGQAQAQGGAEPSAPNRFLGDAKHGRWVGELPDGRVEEGPYVNGKRHGH